MSENVVCARAQPETYTRVACILLVKTLYSPQKPSTTLYDGNAARELRRVQGGSNTQNRRNNGKANDVNITASSTKFFWGVCGPFS